MEVMPHDSTINQGGANKNQNQSECISSQPTANGILPHHNTAEAPPPLSDRAEDLGIGSGDSVTDSFSTNDVCCLQPAHSASEPPQMKQTDVDRLSASPPPVSAPPISAPPSSSSAPPPLPLRTSTCKRQSCSLPHHHHHYHHHHHHHHHHSTNQNRLSSTKSHTSFKTDAAHIREVARDDCCAHCVLACLFCELLSMCSALGECLACGVGGAGCCDSMGCCCCCVEAAGEAACTEEACQAVLDCGILEDCCGSSDCLEVCLECCSICFPS